MAQPTSNRGHVHLVVPAYNPGQEFADFLPELAEAAGTMSTSISIQVVNDGSNARSAALISERCAMLHASFDSVLPPLVLPFNRGKGAAIKEGWRKAPPRSAWLGFADADGSVPVSEICRLIRGHCDTSAQRCIAASRQRVRGKNVERKLHRHVIGRVFARLTRLVVKLPVHDTQCGFKLLPADLYSKIAATLREDRFAFDVELLCRVRQSGAEVVEEPIDWSDRGDSTVRLWRDIPDMFAALLRIRRRLRDCPLQGPSRFDQTFR